MGVLTDEQIEEVKQGLLTDLSLLGKLYKSKKSGYFEQNVDHSRVEKFKKDGWEEFGQRLKTKTKLRRLKDHLTQFKDEIWCQFYELGYRCLNVSDPYEMPISKKSTEFAKFDLLVKDEESIFIIDVRSTDKARGLKTLVHEFDHLELRLDAYRKVFEQVYGRDIKLKYIYAARNYRLSADAGELEKLIKTKSFFYNDNTYDYVNRLIKSYKGAAKYQFLGLLFKNQLINNNKVSVPALEGDMGGKKYYMFSIEPHLLLRMAFILHRTRANESEMPTYQRLLVPQRLTKISKFIDEGGFFPNSIILNFSQKKHKVIFESSGRASDSQSKFGTLKIPNAYALAYIIDGQHRVYGYANSQYKESNTIPVVAFTDLSPSDQLEIFMDINQNQKAVSPDLRITLEDDLFWDSDRADSRLKALKSSIVQSISESADGPLFRKISVGEDKSFLSLKSFTAALTKSGLLPSVRGNKYNEESLKGAMFDISNPNPQDEMSKAKGNIVRFVNACYQHIEENYPELFTRERSFILSNRGSVAFMGLVGSLHKHHMVNVGDLSLNSSPEERFNSIVSYINSLMDSLKDLSKEEEESLLSKYGTGADLRWFRNFQMLVHAKHPDYEPLELIEWKERQDKNLQAKGRGFGVEIEKHMKATVLSTIKDIFLENWELEINSIKRKCLDRAEAEMEKNYKEGLGKTKVEWTEMFTINDYKSIIDKYWGRKPEDEITGFRTFQEQFSIDIGEGLGSKSKSIKWISKFNSLRNSWAHEGTKEKGLSNDEVLFLEKLHKQFYVDA